MSEVRGTGACGADEVAKSGTRYAVTLLVDGRDLPLKVFLHDMIGGAIVGLVSGLRDAGEPSHLEIEVRRI